jgi:hypothetical protein
MSPKSFPKKWTESEDSQLLKEVSEKTPLKIISKNHERTETAISAHFKKISNGKKIDYSSDSSDSSDLDDTKNLKKIIEEIKFLKIKNKEFEKSMINLQIIFNTFSIDCENKFGDLESSIENLDSKI